MAVHPVRPPAHDSKAANRAWLNGVPKPDGKPYAVFVADGYSALMRWIRGDGEFDGRGLADAVKTNATEQNAHIKADDVRHVAINHELDDLSHRVSALEAAPRPFLSGRG